MKCFSIVAAAAALACSAVLRAVRADGATTDQGDKQWSYKTNDASVYGPAEWGKLYPACDGSRQSPIDIQAKTRCGDASVPPPLVLSGECAEYEVHQYRDAFKVEANATTSTCQVAANGKPFKFLQAHFHAPAEHTVDGKVHDAEIHYVHQAADGGLLVIGLFFQKQQGATTDPFVLDFWQQTTKVTASTPAHATLASFFPTLESTIKAGRLFNYAGSLTNPTCAETVDWWVVESPLAVSPADFDVMAVELKRLAAADDGKAARPTQPLNGRTITVY